ncbi:hypothetical protein QBC35DRAFT_265465 [Podospora australis]|uniref:PKS-NRPS hybrid synthetase n=1 Tax=Podospora australis TaxID=1536484 RepID=A0AAN6WUD0_9PEZI|nr:hypothetical protein QBC35DRAFT_265465 [Podospora australis]
MDAQGAPGASQVQPRGAGGRKRQRNTRATETGNTAAPAHTPVNQMVNQVSHGQPWGAMASSNHGQAVRGHVIDTVSNQQQQPTFPSQQLDRSHQVADTDGLMGSYNTPQHPHPHTQYPETQSILAPAPQPDTTSLSSLSTLAGEQHHTQHSHQQQQQQQQQQHAQHPSQHHAHGHHQQQQQQQHHHAQQQQQQVQSQSQQQQQTQQHQQPPGIAINPNTSANKTDGRALFTQQYGVPHTTGDTSPAAVVTSAPTGPTYNNNLPVWPGTPTTPAPPQQPPPPPPPPPQPKPRQASSMPVQSSGQGTAGLAPPVEALYPNFNDLLAAVQIHAKEQGYNIVKLRASNYRDGSATRYDLVCDRGGVKYNSTAKKRNPSTRKVDCPWRAKAVCEVSSGNQWRFIMQDGRHNHEARTPAAPPGQENTPVAQSMRSLNNKVDRMAHDMSQGFSRLEAAFLARLDSIERRLDTIESGRSSLMGGNGIPSMNTPTIPTANMGGGGGLGNASLTNGGMQPLVDNRMGQIDSRMSQLENRSLDALPMMEDDGTGRLSMMVNS